MKKIIQKVFLSAMVICMLAMPTMAESPVINSVTLDPAEPNIGDDIFVTVIVSGDGVTAVTANDEPLSNSVDDIWEGTITAINGTHTVNISVSDADDNIVSDETASYTTISEGTAGGEGIADETTEIIADETVDETIEIIADETVDETTEIIVDNTVDETDVSSGEDTNGIPGFGLLTGLSVMLIATRFLREDK